MGKFIYLIYKLKQYHNKKLPVLVFVPTIDECENIFQYCQYFVKNGNYVHSKKEDREIIVQDFKNNKYDYLITTSVLERGVTLKNVQVIVYNADHQLFDKKTLVQIAGRVGRKIDAYDGEVIYIASYESEAMVESIEHIEQANR